MPIELDDTFPAANACAVAVAERGGATDVHFAPDPHGGPECLWFHLRLRVRPPAPPGGLRLVLRHAGNALGLNNPAGLRPVWRADGGDWQRLPPGQPHPLPDGRRDIAWNLDAPRREAELALCYPYGGAELDTLVAETGGYWQADEVGVSQGARPLVRLSNDYGREGDGRPGVYLIARQHAGETPGSWVLDGLLRQLAAAPDAAPRVWTVPLANIDGIEQGDYGKDNFPYDLNRAWGAAPMRHETLVVQRDLRRWRARCRPVAALDFHAPGGTESGGMYGYLPDPARLPEMHEAVRRLAEDLAAALTDRYAASDFARLADYPSRWTTPTFATFCCRQLAVPSFALETPYALAGRTLLTRRAYRDAGRRVAEFLRARCGG
jgi:hypothetical protein